MDKHNKTELELLRLFAELLKNYAKRHNNSIPSEYVDELLDVVDTI